MDSWYIQEFLVSACFPVNSKLAYSKLFYHKAIARKKLLMFEPIKYV